MFDLMNLNEQNDLLENLSFLATLIGVPILLVSYITSLIAENRRREVGTYDTLETQYVEFQKTALMYARLDVGDCAFEEAPKLNAQELAQQRTLYMMLFSLFERAFLMYKTGNLLGLHGMRKAQWAGWEEYMKKYFSRPSCREAWFNGEPPKALIRNDFDDRFERFVMRMIKKNGWV